MFNPFTMLGFHTWLSLAALVLGIVLIRNLLASRLNPTLASAFLATAILTSATGFVLPSSGFLPSHIIGIASLFVLGVAAAALFVFGLKGRWTPAFVLGVVIGTYLDAFVAVAQSFMKIPVLRAMAPTGSEPPFAIAQGVLLMIFIALGVLAVRRFRKAVI